MHRDSLKPELNKFFIWLIREAKIDVIDAENFIEVHGYGGEFGCPVISLNDLIDLYFEEKLND
jgi:hypothetical protein